MTTVRTSPTRTINDSQVSYNSQASTSMTTVITSLTKTINDAQVSYHSEALTIV